MEFYMQEMKPAIIGETIQSLEAVPQKEYDEDYIQNLIFENPNLLRLNEIDVSVGRIAPLCMEFPVDNSGHAVDDLYVDSNGVLTIVECKLIRNHQATREVLGQILDYAKEIVKYDYKELDRRIYKVTKKSLFEKASESVEDLDYELFEENVIRNLKEGRINLVMAGDRISKNVEELVSFLNGYSRMNFKLGVVEIQLFKIPDSDKRIAIPVCLCKTVEYKLYRIDDGGRKENVEIKLENNLELFYEKLKQNSDCANDFRSFVEKLCNDYHLVTVVGRGQTISLNIKSEDEAHNFLSVSDKGLVSFYGLTSEELPESVYNNGKQYIQSIFKALGVDQDYELRWGIYPKIKGNRLVVKQLLKNTNDIQNAIKNYIRENEKILNNY